MITLKDHISMMEYVGKENTASRFIDSMKPLERLDFLRRSVDTYPIKDNLKEPSSISSEKKIYVTIESLVLGQFIMLEQIITGKTKLADHKVDLEIAKLIIRPLHHESFDNEDQKAEVKNEKDILSYDVREVYFLLEKFINNRNKTLFEDFAGVFYDAKSEDDEDVEEEVKNSNMIFNQQWYWYSIVRMLANEDITKYNDIYMLPMSIVLPEMSFLAQRNKIESARQRQQEALRKL